MRLEGVKCRDGLAHASTYVDGHPPTAGVQLWCKVLSVSDDGGPGQPQRIALSLNLVDQRTGDDLDPLHREAAALGAPRSGGGQGGGERPEQTGGVTIWPTGRVGPMPVLLGEP